MTSEIFCTPTVKYPLYPYNTRQVTYFYLSFWLGSGRIFQRLGKMGRGGKRPTGKRTGAKGKREGKLKGGEENERGK